MSRISIIAGLKTLGTGTLKSRSMAGNVIVTIACV